MKIHEYLRENRNCDYETKHDTGAELSEDN